PPSAGVTAGIDLALALVEDDLGRDDALRIARELVVFLRRPGNQAQFSAQLAAQLATPPAARLVGPCCGRPGHPGPPPVRPRVRGADRCAAGPVRRPGPPRVG